eukprot:Blabericola_migrator_1__7820@NODE_3_length_32604_cov_133_371700_g2_i0_p2_GENE_NODE_3_length_32604_cov_133_371700_g2_i0NODE_3_length_32604_cov_133_371700_g2_i0_p2_ORF_typecomplete_len1218_score168_28Ferric_reduct/PF01794_19/8_1e13Ferric_reduct/PF01794_19/5_5e03Ferric_reduct/PF01794_19/5_7e03FAD_binding_8/PF08022_12/3_4e07NAD_binding_6/PF08030_12/1_4e02NAD_binding_6/PF08030_12/0_00046_NODE_3_length_32604_cov_133_371700_g2_i02149425147
METRIAKWMSKGSFPVIISIWAIANVALPMHFWLLKYNTLQSKGDVPFNQGPDPTTLTSKILFKAFCVMLKVSCLLSYAMTALTMCRWTWTHVAKTWLRKFIPLDHLDSIHRWSGIIGWLELLTVTLVYLINWSFLCQYYRRGNESWNFCADFYSEVMITGYLLTFFHTLICITSLRAVRKKRYELFYWSHHFAIAIFILSIVHPMDWRHRRGAKERMQTWPVMIGPVGLYLIDRLIIMMTHRWTSCLECTLLWEPKTIFLKLHGTKGFADQPPGLITWLNVPAVSWLNWHPFSCAHTDETGCIYLIIHCLEGGWTERLFYCLAMATPQVAFRQMRHTPNPASFIKSQTPATPLASKLMSAQISIPPQMKVSQDDLLSDSDATDVPQTRPATRQRPAPIEDIEMIDAFELPEVRREVMHQTSPPGTFVWESPTHASLADRSPQFSPQYDSTPASLPVTGTVYVRRGRWSSHSPARQRRDSQTSRHRTHRSSSRAQTPLEGGVPLQELWRASSKRSHRISEEPRPLHELDSPPYTHSRHLSPFTLPFHTRHQSQTSSQSKPLTPLHKLAQATRCSAGSAYENSYPDTLTSPDSTKRSREVPYHSGPRLARMHPSSLIPAPSSQRSSHPASSHRSFATYTDVSEVNFMPPVSAAIPPEPPLVSHAVQTESVKFASETSFKVSPLPRSTHSPSSVSSIPETPEPQRKSKPEEIPLTSPRVSRPFLPEEVSTKAGSLQKSITGDQIGTGLFMIRTIWMRHKIRGRWGKHFLPDDVIRTHIYSLLENDFEQQIWDKNMALVPHLAKWTGEFGLSGPFHAGTTEAANFEHAIMLGAGGGIVPCLAHVKSFMDFKCPVDKSPDPVTSRASRKTFERFVTRAVSVKESPTMTYTISERLGLLMDNAAYWAFGCYIYILVEFVNSVGALALSVDGSMRPNNWGVHLWPVFKGLHWALAILFVAHKLCVHLAFGIIPRRIDIGESKTRASRRSLFQQVFDWCLIVASFVFLILNQIGHIEWDVDSQLPSSGHTYGYELPGGLMSGLYWDYFCHITSVGGYFCQLRQVYNRGLLLAEICFIGIFICSILRLLRVWAQTPRLLSGGQSTGQISKWEKDLARPSAIRLQTVDVIWILRSPATLFKLEREINGYLRRSRMYGHPFRLQIYITGSGLIDKDLKEMFKGHLMLSCMKLGRPNLEELFKNICKRYALDAQSGCFTREHAGKCRT